MPEIAIIGDEELLQFYPGTTPLSWTNMQTPFGPASYLYSGRVQFKNPNNTNGYVDVILVRRDRPNTAAGTVTGNYGYPSTYGNERIPGEVPYRANIYALKKLGVKYIFSVAHVGRLKESINVNDIYLPDQFIDYTKNRGNLFYDLDYQTITNVDNPYYYIWYFMNRFYHRGDTFFGDGAVANVSMAQPVCPSLGYMLDSAFRKVKDKLVPRYQTTEKPNVFSAGVSASIDGPELPTFGETTAFKLAGCSIGSMTDMPEAKLAREAEIAYATLGLVTEDDYGIPFKFKGTKWAEISAEREKIRAINYWNAKLILTEAVKRCHQLKPDSIAHKALDEGLRTPIAQIPAAARARLAPLLQRFGVTVTNPITAPPVPAGPSITVDVFGDSVARGFGIQTNLVDFIKNLEPTWTINNISANGVTLKAVQLGYTQSYPGAPASEYPLGPQPPFQTKARTGAYTVIEVGLNDAMGITYPNDVISATEFETRLRAMVAIVKGEGRTPILTGLPNIAWETVPAAIGATTIRDRVIAFNAVCQTVASSENIQFANFNSAYDSKTANTIDTIHPTQQNSNKLGQLLQAAIKKAAGI